MSVDSVQEQEPQSQDSEPIAYRKHLRWGEHDPHRTGEIGAP